MRDGMYGIVALATCLLVPPALAHHSFAMFDQTKTVMVEGTVKEFEWINPHVWLHVVAQDASGRTIEWAFEAGSVNQLITAGWRADVVKTGDRVTVGMNPLKDGSWGGMLRTMVIPSGRMMRQAYGAKSDPE